MIIFTFTNKFYLMKSKLIAVVALIALLVVSSCAYHQNPGRYHHGNNGQSRFY